MKRVAVAVIAIAVTLLVSSCVAAPAGAPASSPVGTAGATRPNIVFVLTDDLAMNLVSRMPHVQALEKAGETFGNYDVVDSLCCPSRSAIFTGEYPHDDGVFTNSGTDGGYSAFNSNGNQQRSFAVALQKAGYRTGFMGKYLNGYAVTDPVPPGWNEWDVAGQAGYREFDYDLNENGHAQHYGKAASDYMVDVLAKKGAAFIDSSTSSHQPFMLEVATFAPHAPYTPAPRYATADQGVAYPKTPAYDAAPTNPPRWLAGRPPLTAQQQQQMRASYDKRLEADRGVDDLLGHLQDELTARGVAGETDVVFSSDNGYHMGEYRLLPGKQTAFDSDINVPLVVAGPGVPAGRVETSLVSNIDLAPTFETLGGAPVGSNVDGVSLADLWHGHTPASWQQAVLIEHHGPNDAKGDPDAQNQQHADPPSYEAVRTATALYVRYASGEEEYYDTTHDPNELTNIAAQGVPPSLPRALDALQNCHSASACQAAARITWAPPVIAPS
ncbi:sulfatase family protein [Glaciibacter flavus]|uniref:sulfatase family protein n=1 Tax=Orlajensenia flava TaxID=2565934 RepID=UPI003B0030D7